MKQFIRKHWFLLLMLGVALIFRWPFADGRSAYAYHELPRDLEILKNIYNGSLVYLGPPSSLGSFHFGPAYYYILLPFAVILKFKFFSLAVASMVFSLATIVFSYYVVLYWFKNQKLANLTVLLFSFSILDIQLAKYASNPNFIPFFGLLFVWCLHRRYVIGLFGSMSILVQLHAVAMISVPIIFLMQVRKLKLNLKEIATGSLVFLGLLSPYLYYEFTHSFINLRSLFHLAGSPAENSYLVRLAEYIGFWLSPFISLHSFFNILDVAGMKFYYILGAALLLIIPIVYYNRIHRGASIEMISWPLGLKNIFKYWILIPTIVLLFPFGRNDLRLYYLLIFSPLIFFLMGIGLYNLYARGWRLVVYYLLFLYLVFNIFQYASYQIFVSSFI